MKTAKVLGILLGLVLGILAAKMIGETASYDRAADDRCWVQGGEYKDGKCILPEPDPLSKVCEQYYIKQGEDFVHCLNKDVWTKVDKTGKLL